MKATISKAHVEVYNAVHGAVRNVAHHHKGWINSENAACSIAKRAAGTLTARWPDVLAARNVPSNVVHPRSRGWPPVQAGCKLATRTGGAASARNAAPLRRLWKQLSNMTGEAKRNKDQKRVETLIEILKLIDTGYFK